MKYVFLFCNGRPEQEAWAQMSEEEQNKGYAAVMDWFAQNGSKVSGGQQLQPAKTATTVRKDLTSGGRPIVTDGPFIEGNEVIGGYTEIEVNNLDEAITIAKAWPAGSVEIRPVVER